MNDHPRPFPWLIVGLVVVGLVLVGFFGWRAFRDHRRWEQRRTIPLATDVETIRGWMTVGYIAQTFGVPPAKIFAALNIPEADNIELSIKQLAEKYDREPIEVLTAVQEAIRSHAATRAAEPPPPPPEPGVTDESHPPPQPTGSPP